jgi:hypothetical protein
MAKNLEYKLNYQNVSELIKDDNIKKYIFDKTDELDEQLLIAKFLPPESIVLELGARNAYASRCINKKISIKTNQLSVEPNEEFRNKLEDLSKKLNFKIFIGAISNKELYLNDIFIHLKKEKDQEGPLYYKSSEIKNGPKINTIKYDELLKKYNLKFDAIIADCEGALPKIFEENPKLFKELKYLQLEWDWGKKSCEEFRNKLLQNNFIPIAQIKHFANNIMGPISHNIGHEVFIKKIL